MCTRINLKFLCNILSTGRLPHTLIIEDEEKVLISSGKGYFPSNLKISLGWKHD